jgi:hypothetical protein
LVLDGYFADFAHFARNSLGRAGVVGGLAKGAKVAKGMRGRRVCVPLVLRSLRPLRERALAGAKMWSGGKACNCAFVSRSCTP